MIVIEKRTIEVDLEEFKEEVIELCRLIKKHAPSTIGVGRKALNDHFNLKLKITDFYALSEELGFTIRRSKFWYFEDMKLA